MGDEDFSNGRFPGHACRPPPAFNEIVLARALRSSLAQQRALTRALLEELARVRMEVRDASAVRYHVRAGFLNSLASRARQAGPPSFGKERTLNNFETRFQTV